MKNELTETDCTRASVRIKPKNRSNYHSNWNHTCIISNGFMMGLLLLLFISNTTNLINVTCKDAKAEEGNLQKSIESYIKGQFRFYQYRKYESEYVY